MVGDHVLKGVQDLAGELGVQPDRAHRRTPGEEQLGFRASGRMLLQRRQLRFQPLEPAGVQGLGERIVRHVQQDRFQTNNLGLPLFKFAQVAHGVIARMESAAAASAAAVSKGKYSIPFQTSSVLR